MKLMLTGTIILYNASLKFESNQYATLHTCLCISGILFGKIPLLNKMELRERFCFSFFMGCIRGTNKLYNNLTNFSVKQNRLVLVLIIKV